jgi:hypothetical protein
LEKLLKEHLSKAKWNYQWTVILKHALDASY